MVKLTFGSIGASFSVGSLKAYLAEFISTLLFVFAGVGSAMAYNKLTSDASLDPAGLVAVALAHAFALFVGVSMAANISGGHLNPAVTLGLAIGGNITILTAIFYWIAQVLGSTVACFLLQFVTAGMTIPTHGVSSGMDAFEGVVMEIVITFALVYTVYATAADPKKGSLGIIAPIAIGRRQHFGRRPIQRWFDEPDSLNWAGDRERGFLGDLDLLGRAAYRWRVGWFGVWGHLYWVAHSTPNLRRLSLKQRPKTQLCDCVFVVYFVWYWACVLYFLNRINVGCCCVSFDWIPRGEISDTILPCF
ncbi:hypothetical protein RHMOL_Rhmol09G0143400 [Rhododendron molle]|uniref:Uncharacterized protein n=1 Tax=Rhododendron molle TaxID=49168 RepID=A0ACC0MED1_RHOML|nr:hypothetical protein RHMOL_Rhmol09G0143400 [Rhododendron molle]